MKISINNIKFFKNVSSKVGFLESRIVKKKVWRGAERKFIGWIRNGCAWITGLEAGSR